MASNKHNKPNFKVKHPYAHLVRSILLGVILVCTAVLGNFTLGFFDKGKTSVVSAYTPQTGTWETVASTSLSGGGTMTDPYLIQSEEDLAYLSVFVNSGNGSSTSVKYYHLAADLDLSDYDWAGIGMDCNVGESYTTTEWQNYSFRGYIYGGGYSIRGLKGDTGLFKSTYGAWIYDLVIIDSQIYRSDSQPVGVITNNSISSSYYNCRSMTTNTRYAFADVGEGVFDAGKFDPGKVDQAYVYGQTAGGLVGTMCGGGLYYCSNSLPIFASTADAGRISVGGLVGVVTQNSSFKLISDGTTTYSTTFTGCANYGPIIQHCTGEIVDLTDTTLGGLVGSIIIDAYTNSRFTGCSNQNMVLQLIDDSSSYANMKVNGFVGYVGNMYNCTNPPLSIYCTDDCYVYPLAYISDYEYISNTDYASATHDPTMAIGNLKGSTLYKQYAFSYALYGGGTTTSYLMWKGASSASVMAATNATVIDISSYSLDKVMTHINDATNPITYNAFYKNTPTFVAGYGTSVNSSTTGFYTPGIYGEVGKAYTPVWNTACPNVASVASLASYVNIVTPAIGGVGNIIDVDFDEKIGDVYFGEGNYQTSTGSSYSGFGEFINSQGKSYTKHYSKTYNTIASFSMVPGFVPNTNAGMSVSFTNTSLERVNYTIYPLNHCASYSLYDSLKGYNKNSLSSTGNERGLVNGLLESGETITLSLSCFNILNYNVEFRLDLEGQGTSADPFRIYSEEDYYAMLASDLSLNKTSYADGNYNTAPIYYKLMNDITIRKTNYDAFWGTLSDGSYDGVIGDFNQNPYNAIFSGYFNGNNKLITLDGWSSAADYTTWESYSPNNGWFGLFPQVAHQGVILDLNVYVNNFFFPTYKSYTRFTGVSDYANTTQGLISTINYGTIDSVNVVGGTAYLHTRGNGNHAYGTIAGISTGVIKNCHISRDFTLKIPHRGVYTSSDECTWRIGGVVGHKLDGTTALDQLKNYGFETSAYVIAKNQENATKGIYNEINACWNDGIFDFSGGTTFNSSTASWTIGGIVAEITSSGELSDGYSAEHVETDVINCYMSGVMKLSSNFVKSSSDTYRFRSLVIGGIIGKNTNSQATFQYNIIEDHAFKATYDGSTYYTLADSMFDTIFTSSYGNTATTLSIGRFIGYSYSDSLAMGVTRQGYNAIVYDSSKHTGLYSSIDADHAGFGINVNDVDTREEVYEFFAGDFLVNYGYFAKDKELTKTGETGIYADPWDFEKWSVVELDSDNHYNSNPVYTYSSDYNLSPIQPRHVAGNVRYDDQTQTSDVGLTADSSYPIKIYNTSTSSYMQFTTSFLPYKTDSASASGTSLLVELYDTWARYGTPDFPVTSDDIKFNPSTRRIDVYTAKGLGASWWLLHYSGITVSINIYINNDIDLHGLYWMPYYQTGGSQTIYYYGNYHTIHNMYIDSSHTFYKVFTSQANLDLGFFGRSTSSYFYLYAYNLKFSNPYILMHSSPGTLSNGSHTGFNIGTMVGNSFQGTLNNVDIEDLYITEDCSALLNASGTSTSTIGALIGACPASGTITYCDIYAKSNYYDGNGAQFNHKSKIKYSSKKLVSPSGPTTTNTYARNIKIAGLIGGGTSGYTSTKTISYCNISDISAINNCPTVYGSTWFAGVVGYHYFPVVVNNLNVNRVKLFIHQEVTLSTYIGALNADQSSYSSAKTLTNCFFDIVSYVHQATTSINLCGLFRQTGGSSTTSTSYRLYITNVIVKNYVYGFYTYGGISVYPLSQYINYGNSNYIKNLVLDVRAYQNGNMLTRTNTSYLTYNATYDGYLANSTKYTTMTIYSPSDMLTTYDTSANTYTLSSRVLVRYLDPTTNTLLGKGALSTSNTDGFFCEIESLPSYTYPNDAGEIYNSFGTRGCPIISIGGETLSFYYLDSVARQVRVTLIDAETQTPISSGQNTYIYTHRIMYSGLGSSSSTMHIWLRPTTTSELNQITINLSSGYATYHYELAVFDRNTSQKVESIIPESDGYKSITADMPSGYNFYTYSAYQQGYLEENGTQELRILLYGNFEYFAIEKVKAPDGTELISSNTISIPGACQQYISKVDENEHFVIMKAIYSPGYYITQYFNINIAGISSDETGYIYSKSPYGFNLDSFAVGDYMSYEEGLRTSAIKSLEQSGMSIAVVDGAIRVTVKMYDNGWVGKSVVSAKLPSGTVHVDYLQVGGTTGYTNDNYNDVIFDYIDDYNIEIECTIPEGISSSTIFALGNPNSTSDPDYLVLVATATKWQVYMSGALIGEYEANHTQSRHIIKLNMGMSIYIDGQNLMSLMSTGQWDLNTPMALRLFTGKTSVEGTNTDGFYLHQLKVTESSVGNNALINIIPVINDTKAGLIDLCKSMTMFGSTPIASAVYGDALYGESARDGIEYVNYLDFSNGSSNARIVGNSRLSGFTSVIEFNDVTTRQAIFEIGNNTLNGTFNYLIVENGYLSIHIAHYED